MIEFFRRFPFSTQGSYKPFYPSYSPRGRDSQYFVISLKWGVCEFGKLPLQTFPSWKTTLFLHGYCFLPGVFFVRVLDPRTFLVFRRSEPFLQWRMVPHSFLLAFLFPRSLPFNFSAEFFFFCRKSLLLFLLFGEVGPSTDPSHVSLALLVQVEGGDSQGLSTRQSRTFAVLLCLEDFLTTCCSLG